MPETHMQGRSSARHYCLLRSVVQSCRKQAPSAHFISYLHRMLDCLDAGCSSFCLKRSWPSFLLAADISDVLRLINNLMIRFGVRMMTCCGGSCRRGLSARPTLLLNPVVFLGEGLSLIFRVICIVLFLGYFEPKTKKCCFFGGVNRR
jgi:hypothetical protein